MFSKDKDSKKKKPGILVGFTHDAEGKQRKVEVHPVDEFGKPKIMFHELETTTSEGRFFAELVTKWGMVMGKPDGEDSTGRARITIMTPEEVVARAAETTKLATKAMRENGWIEAVPPFNEIREQLKASKQKDE